MWHQVLSHGLGWGMQSNVGTKSQSYIRCEAHVLLGCSTLHTTHQKHCDLGLHPPGLASLASDLGCHERFLSDRWLEEWPSKQEQIMQNRSGGRKRYSPQEKQPAKEPHIKLSL